MNAQPPAALPAFGDWVRVTPPGTEGTAFIGEVTAVDSGGTRVHITDHGSTDARPSDLLIPGTWFAATQVQVLAQARGRAADSQPPISSRAGHFAALPGWRHQLANYLALQLAWFAAVVGAAHQLPVLGLIAPAAVLGWHLRTAPRPQEEAKLIAVALVLGTLFEILAAQFGLLSYTSGQLWVQGPAYWVIALWGVLASGVNVTMRWFKPRPLVATLMGAVGAPLTFYSGVNLGAGQFVREGPALLLVALLWAIAMPLLILVGNRFDGFTKPHGRMR